MITILNDISQSTTGAVDLIINALDTYKANNNKVPDKFDDIYKYKFLLGTSEPTMTVEEAINLLNSYE